MSLRDVLSSSGMRRGGRLRGDSDVRASTGKIGGAWRLPKGAAVSRSFAHSQQRTQASALSSADVWGLVQRGSVRRDAESDGGSEARLRSRRVLNESMAENFKVAIRIRPPLPRELHGDMQFQPIFKVGDNHRQVVISDKVDEDGQVITTYGAHRFTFDRVYDQFSTQKQVYQSTARPAVLSTLKGYNATILAYGQTGTGKTYTMEGFHSDESRGIIPRAVEEIFGFIMNNANPSARFLVRASYLQIYNEVISDLLKPERTHLPIREDKRKGVFVERLSEWVVRSPNEVYGLIQRGSAIRATGSTRMNPTSSRSHALFIIIIEQNEISMEGAAGQGGRGRQTFRVGKLNLVDLAGSERVRLSGAVGQRLNETKKINKSLSALGNVIAALTEKKTRGHIPYRDSKLTRILEDSLGGNCKTTMMAMISPALMSFNESLSTLKFANRAKNIKNRATINEDLDEKTLLRRYEKELKRLRHELQTRNRNVVDKRKLIEVEEQRRRAEEDKMQALMNMERLTKSLMSEKEAKKRLEEKIRQMNEQLLIGGFSGGAVKETQAFKTALQQEQARIRRIYQTKMAELEREREAMEEEKGQTDRYRQLLLKQRDVMIQLTARLNERDQSIMILQEELEAYDQHQRMMEDALDQKTATLIHLQKKTMQQSKRLENQGVGGAAAQRQDRTPAAAAGEATRGPPAPIAADADAEAAPPAAKGADVFNAWGGARGGTAGGSGGGGDNAGVSDDAHRQALELLGDTKAKLQALQTKYSVQLQERTAVCVILEKKMKTLVDRVASSMLTDTSLNPQTRQEIEVLQRLIHASVIALKQSEPLQQDAAAGPAAKNPVQK